MNNKIRWMARLSITATAYVVLTLICYPFSFGMIQVRIAEALMLLVCYNKKYSIALIIGCFIANLFSSLGIIDCAFGTLATAIACVIMMFIKNKYIAFIIPVITNAFIIALELYIVSGVPYLLSALYVGLGELVSMSIALLLSLFDKRANIKDLLINIREK